MDIQVPDPSAGPGQALDEINATRILHREMPRVGIVFCAMCEDDEVVFVGPQAGGWG